jgi:hypothetical protein
LLLPLSSGRPQRVNAACYINNISRKQAVIQESVIKLSHTIPPFTAYNYGTLYAVFLVVMAIICILIWNLYADTGLYMQMQNFDTADYASLFSITRLISLMIQSGPSAESAG